MFGFGSHKEYSVVIEKSAELQEEFKNQGWGPLSYNNVLAITILETNKANEGKFIQNRREIAKIATRVSQELSLTLPYYAKSPFAKRIGYSSLEERNQDIKEFHEQLKLNGSDEVITIYRKVRESKDGTRMQVAGGLRNLRLQLGDLANYPVSLLQEYDLEYIGLPGGKLAFLHSMWYSLEQEARYPMLAVRADNLAQSGMATSPWVSTTLNTQVFPHLPYMMKLQVPKWATVDIEALANPITNGYPDIPQKERSAYTMDGEAEIGIWGGIHPDWVQEIVSNPQKVQM